jgi:hypothetical protein
MRRLPILLAAACWSSAGIAADFPIAGLTPNQRPAGAPVITVFKPGPDWEKRMFHGISQPFPPSLRWVRDQGAWYTPFNRPGMSAPYDIRGWRVKEAIR